MRTLQTDYAECVSELTKLSALARNVGKLEPVFQKLVAEITFLRLFYVLENGFQAFACKLLCGCSYLDGSLPVLLSPSASISAAADRMRKFGRVRAHDLKWSKASEVNENVRYLIDASDHYVRVINFHGSLIDEMRRVRNRIAHNNQQSRKNFRVVVHRHYGAYLNQVTPGLLLVSPRRSPPLLDQYLAKALVLVKELARG